MSAPNPELDLFHLEALVHNGHPWQRAYSRVALSGALEVWLPPVYTWAGSDASVFIMAMRPRPNEPYRAYSNRPNLPSDSYRRSEVLDYGSRRLLREDIIGGYVGTPRDRVAFGIGSAIMDSGLWVFAGDSQETAQLNVALTNYEYGRDALQWVEGQQAA